MGKHVILTDRVMRPIAHFSHAVRVGGVIHLGATAGTEADRRLAGATPGRADVEAQIAQMFENVKVVLGLLDAGLERVVRIKTYVTDLRDLPRYEAFYAQVFGDIRPDHVIVGSAGFPLPQAAIELDLVAEREAPVERFPQAGNASSAAGRHYCSAGPVLSTALGHEVARDTFAAQADCAFRQLQERLAAGGRRLADTVYLHATLRENRFVDEFRHAFDRYFPNHPPAGVIVIAPLADVEWMLQLEAIAVPGGGTPITDGSGPAGWRLGSPAVLAEEDLFIGAQIGIGRDGQLVSGVEAQTRAAWSRIRSLLNAAGMTADDILRTNNVLTDWRSYAGFNAGYGAEVGEPYPPRTTVHGALAAFGALVQIEAVAHRSGHGAMIVQAG